MMDVDRLLAKRLQAREQEELTNEEKARLFVELLEKRKKHFAALRAQEKRNNPPTKAQKKSTMSTYLKHMAGYKQNEDQEEAKLKELMEVISNKEGVAIDAIPLSTKPPSIGRIVRIKRLHDDLRVTAAQEIVENGNAPIVTKNVDGKETVIPPISVEEKAQRRAELKAISNLLLRTDLEVIASSTEVIEQTYERLKKVISRLEMHEIETLSLNDLFNNLKAYESEVKGTSSSTTNSHNVAFLSSSSTKSATRVVNTIQGVNTASTQGAADSSTTIKNLINAVIYSFFASQPSILQIDNEDL
ncbi:hypothetical protein Tco_0701903, partial [Tanacetum coccineum]